MRITSRNGCSFSAIARERSHRFGDARAGQVGLAAHDGRDGAGVVAALVAVVGQAHRHQQRAQVREAQAQRTVVVRVLRDLLGRIAGVVDDDLLRQDQRIHRVAEGLDVELAVRPTNFIRFSDDRLQAESSRNMYSEQGLDALMRAVFLQGCQRLTVVSNCMPGSPHWCVASAICRSRSRAL